MNNKFQREDRYVVFKISKLDSNAFVKAKQIEALNNSFLEDARVACVVVEADWPEYEPVWQMIERRVNGVAIGQPEVVAGGEAEAKRFHLDATDGRRAEMVESQEGHYCEFEHVTRLQAEISALRGLTPGLPPRPPEGHGLPRYGLRWNGPSQPLAVPMEDGYWTPWHLADQLRAELTELQRADECWSAVVSYMMGAGSMQEPLEFLRCWNEGNFESIRNEWPDAPKEVFYADPLSNGEAS